MNLIFLQRLLPVLLLFVACRDATNAPSRETIEALNLKTGKLISCGPADNQFGTLAFDISGTKQAKEKFVLGLKMLHSFEYEEAEKVFASIIEQDPSCAMAYWGIAMSNFHPLWAPPSKAELEKGSKALAIAGSLNPHTQQEAAYIQSIAAFYKDWEKVDHRTRCLRFENALEQLHQDNPSDKEAAILYALALVAAADPTDKTFQKQKKAGEILQSLSPDAPNHPGITHYLIHTYDAPELASLALPAARKYASIAPSSAHALHMPSHIFTRLGLWDEDIHSNLESVSSAQCYAQQTGLQHWDEELHAQDYLVYAYLQKGDNAKAKQQLNYLLTIKEVKPANFKVAYAFAAIPARYMLENKLWDKAASLEFPAANFSWNNFIWQKAIIHFAKLLGSVHTGQLKEADTELKELSLIHDSLLAQKDDYKAKQVQVQILSGQAWMLLKSGNRPAALQLMKEAASLEDKTEKHPVTPSEVIPAMELLADMYMELKDYPAALEAYEKNLIKHPNRFNGLYGAAVAAEKSGDHVQSTTYFRQLINIAEPTSDRHELQVAHEKLKRVI